MIREVQQAGESTTSEFSCTHSRHGILYEDPLYSTTSATQCAGLFTPWAICATSELDSTELGLFGGEHFLPGYCAVTVYAAIPKLCRANAELTCRCCKASARLGLRFPLTESSAASALVRKPCFPAGTRRHSILAMRQAGTTFAQRARYKAGFNEQKLLSTDCCAL